jgi:predicted DCC family thiol-disulfide oxidoreductase YuxK
VIDNVPKDKELILFDGVCNLCNSSVLYVIKRDKKNKFLFAPLQSEMGQAIINAFNIDTEETDSIILYKPKERKIYHRSTAALSVAKSLNFPTNLMVVFFIVPTFIRNWVYNYIAKNRYTWYGKKESCMIPTPELTSKFLA